MVTRSPTHLRARRIVAAVVVAVVAVLGVGAGSSMADPGSYGFDQACNQLHDAVDSVPGLGFLGDAASAACKAGNVALHPTDAVDAVKDKAWDTTFGSVVDSLLHGLGQALIMSLVWWTHLPNDKLLAEQDLWARISKYTTDIQVYCLAASVMVGAVRIAIARHNAHGEQAGEVMRVLARSVVAVWIAGAVILSASRASDAFAAWIIDDVTDGNAAGTAAFMVETTAYTGFSPGLILIVACVGMLGALAMAVMAILRQAFLVVAMGLLPIAAAGSGLGSGKHAHDRLWSWVVAFLLWKPVAALVYLIAFSTVDTTSAMNPTAPLDADAGQRRLVGLMLLICAVFVLPALMRLVSPVVSAAGSGGSGAAAVGMVLTAGAAVATGGKALIARGGSAASRGAATSASSTGGGSASGGSATGHVTRSSARTPGSKAASAKPSNTSSTAATSSSGTPAGAAPGHTRTPSSSTGAAAPAAPPQNKRGAPPPTPPRRQRGGDDIPI
ncbi:hypothetical protein HLB23_24540 [Nocardia uniformis]|uniref:Uncharacterized protein n=1 Tax=Nocardia uniformis TaxID=53432 RepID=A0A849C9E4_9NOCA|nr:hypothetical protein [Nocardia uniformis]NNH72990.1 hypothetical protein [Nocardia uniformis]